MAKRARDEALALAKANPILPLKRASWARAALEGVPLLKRARSGDRPGVVAAFHIPDRDCDVSTAVFDISDPGESLLAVGLLPHDQIAGSMAASVDTAVSTAGSIGGVVHQPGGLAEAVAMRGGGEVEAGDGP